MLRAWGQPSGEGCGWWPLRWSSGRNSTSCSCCCWSSMKSDTGFKLEMMPRDQVEAAGSGISCTRRGGWRGWQRNGFWGNFLRHWAKDDAFWVRCVIFRRKGRIAQLKLDIHRLNCWSVPKTTCGAWTIVKIWTSGVWRKQYCWIRFEDVNKWNCSKS